MKTCEQCKFWEKCEDEFDREYRGENSGRCSSDKFIYDIDHKVPDDGLLYWDYEGYSAGFMTGGNFGCIHWEEIK